MNKKLVIGIVGEKGSGKGTASRHLIERYGAIQYTTSDILKRTINDLHLTTTRENFVKLALVIKNGFRPSIIVEALIADIEEKKPDNNIIIIDGIRMFGDVDPFRKKYGKNFYLFYVTADIRTRYERTKMRKEKSGEDKTTFEEFLAEEGRLTEVSIGEIGKTADFTLTNDEDAEFLQKQIDKIMKKIIKN